MIKVQEEGYYGYNVYIVMRENVAECLYLVAYKFVIVCQSAVILRDLF